MVVHGTDPIRFQPEISLDRNKSTRLRVTFCGEVGVETSRLSSRRERECVPRQTAPTLAAATVKIPNTLFHERDFGRIVALSCRYRGTLLLGVLCTMLYAWLHTVSLGGAFPLFKILLEEEGLRGWADRTVAGQRLGVAFAPPPTSAAWVGLLSVDQDSELFQAGLRVGDRVRAPQRRLAAELLHDLAHVDLAGSVTLEVDSPDAQDQPQTVTVRPTQLKLSGRLARWAVDLIPPSVDRQKLGTLKYLVAGLIVVVVLANVFRYLGEVMTARAVLRAMMRLRGSLYERTLRLPMSFFAGRETSDIVGRFVQDVQEAQRGLLSLFRRFIREPLRIVFILGLALTLDWRCTLMIIMVAPLVVFMFWRVGKQVHKSSKKLLEAYGEMIGTLTMSLQNLRIVKAYTAEHREQDRLRPIDWRVFKQQLKLAKFQAFVTPAMETMAVVAGSFVVIWLAGRVQSQDMSIAKFAALGVVLSVLFDPLRRLSSVYVRVVRASAGAERIFQVIDQPIEADLAPAHVELKPLVRAIEFANVSFTYPGADTPALRDVSLSIAKGETVAIVGPNGSGKTTLVSMLPRFFDPDVGQVLFDGIDVRNASLGSLRRQIGLVSQEAIVFPGTPAENIAYGESTPDVLRAANAARRASADEFISSLPDRYEASLGERGVALSGGQRQRLAIARVIFRDAPILICDEASSQVDSESELRIRNAIMEFSKDRTTLIIAHRLSTIQFATRIVVMDAGRVVDTGPHKELLDRCLLYRNLCETRLATETGEGDGNGRG